MFFDVALLSVIVVTGYLGPAVLRRLGNAQRAYGIMLLVDAFVAAIALLARRNPEPDQMADLLGFVAIGAGFCLVVLPTFLRDLARRCLASEKLRIARFLVELREMLQPGMGGRQELDFIDTVLAVRGQRVDAAVASLRKSRGDSPDENRRIDERIGLLFLYARRWEDAVAQFEGPLSQHGPVSTQIVVEMVRAYCEVGQLESAATLVERLEGSMLAEEPVFSFLINRARLMFLAFVGRTAAVDSMVGQAGVLKSLPDSARSFWSGVARLHAGDKQGAKEWLKEAAVLSKRDVHAREIAEETLDSVDSPGVLGPHRIPPPVAELADLVMARATKPVSPSEENPPRLRGVSWRTVPATILLVAANLLFSAFVYFTWGSIEDIGVLVRVGANVESLVAQGDYWRLLSSMFLHVGWVHLLLNVYGLWVLGRLTEQFFGTTRVFVIYSLAGLAGSVASHFFSHGGVSAGASGAVFGLLGAAIVELGLGRGHYPKAWRGALFGNLLFLAIANVLVGFVYPVIDQAAHLGGFGAGAILSLLASRRRKVAKSLILRGLFAAAAVLCLVGFGGAAKEAFFHNPEEALSKVPVRSESWEGTQFDVPVTWTRQEEPKTLLVGEDTGVLFDLRRVQSNVPLATLLEQVVDETHYGGAKSLGFDSAFLPRAPRLVVEKPWLSDELVVTVEAGPGTQRFRGLIMVQAVSANEAWLGRLFYPEALGSGMKPVLRRMLSSFADSSAK